MVVLEVVLVVLVVVVVVVVVVVEVVVVVVVEVVVVVVVVVLGDGSLFRTLFSRSFMMKPCFCAWQFRRNQCISKVFPSRVFLC